DSPAGSGKYTNRVKTITVAPPVVGTTQNGPGTADQYVEYVNTFGLPVWVRRGGLTDPDRIFDYYEYDLGTGAVTRAIAHAATSRALEFALPPPPDNPPWTTAPGRGLHLRTIREVDRIGRETSHTVTSPAQATGTTTYTVYKDPSHQVRVYP